MKIPFGLHRRIPKIRHVLELLAQTTAERDSFKRERDALEDELAHTRSRVTLLERALGDRIAQQKPLIYGNVDHRMGETTRHILSLLRPMDVVGKQLVRKGKPHDGGYVMVNSGLEGSVAYSLGINDDVSWDLDMAALGCEIFQYDHTIEGLPQQNPRFHWFKTGIAATVSADGTLQPLDSLIAKNGHADRQDLILKMDIEGYEWGVIEAMNEATLNQFSQITMEMHTLALATPDLQAKIAAALEKLYASHQAVHVHANNHGYFGIVGGVPIPDTIEVTYLRRDNHEFAPCLRIFPTDMDMPCRYDVPDFFLGPIGAMPEPVLARAATAEAR